MQNTDSCMDTGPQRIVPTPPISKGISYVSHASPGPGQATALGFLALAQSGAAAEAGVQDAHSCAAGQPGEESVGLFGTDLNVSQDSWPRMCTQPWESNV